MKKLPHLFFVAHFSALTILAMGGNTLEKYEPPPEAEAPESATCINRQVSIGKKFTYNPSTRDLVFVQEKLDNTIQITTVCPFCGYSIEMAAYSPSKEVVTGIISHLIKEHKQRVETVLTYGYDLFYTVHPPRSHCKKTSTKFTKLTA